MNSLTMVQLYNFINPHLVLSINYLITTHIYLGLRVCSHGHVLLGNASSSLLIVARFHLDIRNFMYYIVLYANRLYLMIISIFQE